jgi:glycosyltransferase involved in cell wall biosynthesis
MNGYSMRFCFLTNIVSPHQMPVARELAHRVGDGCFLYVSTGLQTAQREKLGWNVGALPDWVAKCSHHDLFGDGAVARYVRDCEILLTNERLVWLMADRSARGLKTFYMFERWFKPPLGMLRLLHPRFLRMAWGVVNQLKRGQVYAMPIGVHAAADMARLCGLFSGELTCLSRAPRVTIESKRPLARFRLDGPGSPTGRRHAECQCGLDRMRLWAYFVEGPSLEADHEVQVPAYSRPKASGQPLRVLWVGRMLRWKRVDTLIQACQIAAARGTRIHLKLVGCGPEEDRLRRLTKVGRVADSRAAALSERFTVEITGPVPITAVRGLMRAADVYVLPSDGYEGWGAVVNEAMGEGCCVIGTQEAGSSATLIDDGYNGFLFNAGDVVGLASKLVGIESGISAGDISKRAVAMMRDVWSPGQAADAIIRYVSEATGG